MTDQDVFRFVAVRPPRRVDDAPGRVFPRGPEGAGTPLRQAIARLDPGPDLRRRAQGLAAELMASAFYVFDDQTTAAAFHEVGPIADLLDGRTPSPNGGGPARALASVLKAPPADFVRDDRYRQLRDRFWDSLYAQALLPAARPYDLEAIVTGVRVLHLLQLLAAAEPAAVDDALVRSTWAAVRSRPPLLPVDLAPAGRRPTAANPNPNPTPALPRAEPIEAERPALAELRRIDEAMAELRRLGRPGPRPAVGELPPADAPDEGAAWPRRGIDRVLEVVAPHGARLRSAWGIDAAALGDPTRDLLREHGIDLTTHAVGEALATLEARAGRVRQGLGGAAAVSAPVVPVGTTLAFTSVAGATTLRPDWQAALDDIRGVGGEDRPYRILGFGDLEVVRQRLLRYEAGDIAHIENVMETESRTRSHEWHRQTEETLVVETERTDERARDLQTTERFELQREAERTIETDTSVQAGTTVSGKYGLVNVTASGNFAHSSARSESDRNASTFARDITDRAVERVTTRVREERIRRTLEEVTETNTHGFVNTNGDHVRGVYQWVDKVYEAQVVNYGQRLMIELVVPEPAAFHLYSLRNPTLPDDAPVRPPDPVVPLLTSAGDAYLRDADGNIVYRPLAPGDLLPGTFERWISAYGVTDANPPPPESVFIGTSVAKKREAQSNGAAADEEWTSVSDEGLMVPPGYRAVAGWVVASATQPLNADPYNTYAIAGRALPGFDANGEAAFSLAPEPSANPAVVDDPAVLGIDGTIPISYHSNAPFHMTNFVVHCLRTPERLHEWQLATFASITTAHRALRQAYEDARRRLQRSFEIAGTNPARNTQVVRDELKRSCITMLTGERFDAFDAVRPDALSRYPEIDLDEARDEGAVIRFVEQAFEWDQLTYLFYPYFWGRKEHWPETVGLDDTDPAFADFLRAGAARVILPVQPAAAAAVALFLGSNGGVGMDGIDIPTVGDELFVSIADELRARQGADFVQGPGVVSVAQGSRTVTGQGTAFDLTHDADRELMVDGHTVRIQRVVNGTELVLGADYDGDSLADAAYALGPRLVGLPWEVRVPTSLVYLRDETELPDWTDERGRR